MLYIHHEDNFNGKQFILDSWQRDSRLEQYLIKSVKRQSLRIAPNGRVAIYAPPFFGKSTLGRQSSICIDGDETPFEASPASCFWFSNSLTREYDYMFFPTIERKYDRFLKLLDKFGPGEVTLNGFRRLCLVNLGYSIIGHFEKNDINTKLIIFNIDSTIDIKNDLLDLHNILLFEVRSNSGSVYATNGDKTDQGDLILLDHYHLQDFEVLI